uniref:Proteinase inhibitor SE60-like protein n=1 Tax=Ammopiptanthus mongolicus TaxID=126911 RepID=Q5I7M3_AMMMO|nr:proteinase inhibitor SE60-like protein [Ammopiptanthus mongolicus]
MLLVLLASQEMVVQTEGLFRRKCPSVLSNRFKGKCFSDHNCASVCQLEGYFGGDCRGLRQRCFCTKSC